MVRVTKFDASTLTTLTAELERLAVQGQLEFIYNGDVVAGHGEKLVIDPAAEVPIHVNKDNVIRVVVVLADQ